MSWKTIDSKALINEFHVSVYKNKVELSNGIIIDDFYTVTIPDAAMVAAITKDGKIVLKTEYRFACKENTIECPAGMFEKNENEPLEVAKRELLEETGYTSSEWTYLGSTRESTSKLTNVMHMFLATECQQTSAQRLDENEHIDLMAVSLDAAVKMVMTGVIKANSTAHLILKVARMMGV